MHSITATVTTHEIRQDRWVQLVQGLVGNNPPRQRDAFHALRRELSARAVRRLRTELGALRGQYSQDVEDIVQQSLRRLVTNARAELERGRTPEFNGGYIERLVRWEVLELGRKQIQRQNRNESVARETSFSVEPAFEEELACAEEARKYAEVVANESFELPPVFRDPEDPPLRESRRRAALRSMDTLAHRLVEHAFSEIANRRGQAEAFAILRSLRRVRTNRSLENTRAWLDVELRRTRLGHLDLWRCLDTLEHYEAEIGAFDFRRAREIAKALLGQIRHRLTQLGRSE